MTRANSFTFLRLAFALSVVFAHCYYLGGFNGDWAAGTTGGRFKIGAAGSLAVNCFFVVSGFLITGSIFRQSSVWRFALLRCARILPGFWAVQLISAFLLAPAVTLYQHGWPSEYWNAVFTGPTSAFGFLLHNAGLWIFQSTIGDVFARNPVESVINGSLWSLAPEATCYICLALLSVVGGLRIKAIAPALFAIVYGLHIYGLNHPEILAAVGRVLEKCGIFAFDQSHYRAAYLAFLAGLTCYQFREFIPWKNWVGAVSVLALLAGGWMHSFEFVWPFALPYLILFLAHRLPFQRVEEYGDFSYGIYIYSYPIQQCLTLAGCARFGFWWYAVASIALSVGAGVLSWRWLEEPMISRARRSNQFGGRGSLEKR